MEGAGAVESAGDVNRQREVGRISDDELAALSALDPAAATSTKSWELEVTSRALRRWAVIAVVVIMAAHIFMSLVVDVGSTGAAITGVDKWSFTGVGIILSGVAFIGLRRPRVRVNADGVEVRNFIGTRFYPWTVIYGLSFPRGSRVARLELPDFEYVPMWAMLAADSSTIVDDVNAFRALEAAYMPQD